MSDEELIGLLQYPPGEWVGSVDDEGKPLTWVLGDMDIARAYGWVESGLVGGKIDGAICHRLTPMGRRLAEKLAAKRAAVGGNE